MEAARDQVMYEAQLKARNQLDKIQKGKLATWWFQRAGTRAIKDAVTPEDKKSSDVHQTCSIILV